MSETHRRELHALEKIAGALRERTDAGASTEDCVGVERLIVHDEHRPDPSLAFALSRLADRPESPTPVGVFRAVDKPSYEVAMQRQLVDAAERSGPADLGALLRNAPTWTVN